MSPVHITFGRNGSRVRRGALIVGTLALALYNVVVPAAGAVVSGPTLTTSSGDQQVLPGAVLTVTGHGFVAGMSYELYGRLASWTNPTDEPIALTADSGGSFTASYRVPVTAPCAAGAYDISAVPSGSPSDRPVAQVQVLVQLCDLGEPSIVIAERNIPFTLAGSGFVAGENVSLTSPNGRLTVTRATANAQGTFSISQRVEEPIRPQLVTITATGATSQRAPSSTLVVSNSTLWAGYKLLSQRSEVDDLVAPTKDIGLGPGPGEVSMGYGGCGFSVAGPGQSGFDSSSLNMQTDGNLVLYDTHTGKALWSTRTAGTGAHNHLVVQDGGNAVLYSSTGRVLWQSATIVNPVLKAGQTMRSGQYLFDCGYRLSLATVGGLWLTGANSQQASRLWSMPAPGAGERLVLQTDGNLVLYSSRNRALWSTHTAGTGSHNRLVLRPLGNLVLYNAQNRALWSTNTGG